MTDTVEIIEVSPRDGLQNEAERISTEDKLRLIRRAMEAGARRVEVASFVHPRVVPQMADAEAVCAGLPDRPDIDYIGLVLNEKGLDRALATEALDDVGCVAVASDGFGRANQNQTIGESIEVSSRIVRRARSEGLKAHVTISVAFGCPFDGEVDPETVVEIAARVAEAEPCEIALADTIGVGVPDRVAELVDRVAELIGDIPLRMHFHDTRNTAIANAQASLAQGVRRLDSSIGGIGGCPFAPAATGNVATEDLLFMLHRSGYTTGMDLQAAIDTARWMDGVLKRELPGRVSRAGGFPR